MKHPGLVQDLQMQDLRRWANIVRGVGGGRRREPCPRFAEQNARNGWGEEAGNANNALSAKIRVVE